MIYTTLKENRKNNIDIINICDDLYFSVGGILNELENTKKYINYSENTNWEIVEQNYNKKKLESIVLKYMKKYVNNKNEMYLLKYEKFLFDLDFLVDELEILIKQKLLNELDLINIERLCNKYNIKSKCIKEKIVDGKFKYIDISDLRYIYFSE